MIRNSMDLIYINMKIWDYPSFIKMLLFCRQWLVVLVVFMFVDEMGACPILFDSRTEDVSQIEGPWKQILYCLKILRHVNTEQARRIDDDPAMVSFQSLGTLARLQVFYADRLSHHGGSSASWGKAWEITRRLDSVWKFSKQKHRPAWNAHDQQRLRSSHRATVKGNNWHSWDDVTKRFWIQSILWDKANDPMTQSLVRNWLISEQPEIAKNKSRWSSEVFQLWEDFAEALQLRPLERHRLAKATFWSWEQKMCFFGGMSNAANAKWFFGQMLFWYILVQPVLRPSRWSTSAALAFDPGLEPVIQAHCCDGCAHWNLRTRRGLFYWACWCWADESCGDAPFQKITSLIGPWQ